MGTIGAFLLASIIPWSGLVAQSTGKVSRTWVAASYHGLVVGKSTRSDVLRVLGKPKWVGREQDTGIPMMTYAVSDPVPGTLAAYFRGPTLDGMALYPKPSIIKQDVIHLFGSGYVMVRYATDDCLSESGTAPLYESPEGPVRRMEYRDRGLAVSFDGDNVEAILFVKKQSIPTQSRCRGQQKQGSAEFVRFKLCGSWIGNRRKAPERGSAESRLQRLCGSAFLIPFHERRWRAFHPQELCSPRSG